MVDSQAQTNNGFVKSTESLPPIDGGIFIEFESINTDILNMFSGDKTYRSEERARFESGEIVNPKFDYPYIDLGDIDAKTERLLELQESIIQGDYPDFIKYIYAVRIKHDIGRLQLVKASKENRMRDFSILNEALFGLPNQESFVALLGDIQLEVEKHLEHPNAEIRNAAFQFGYMAGLFDSHIRPNSSGLANLDSLNPMTYKNLLGDVSELFVELEDEKEYSAEEIVSTFKKALDTLNMHEWEVEIDQKAKNINVKAKGKKISVPEKRKAKGDYVKKLIIEEVGTHALRSYNGTKSQLRILGNGLIGYLPLEEGLAAVRQDALEGITELKGRNEYLAMCLALGYDGTPRNFRETYEWLFKYFYMVGLLKRVKDGEITHKAREEALQATLNNCWKYCTNVFRGTNGQTRGVVFTFSRTYRDGHISILNHLRERGVDIDTLMLGKYDPTNPVHLNILQNAGIISW